MILTLAYPPAVNTLYGVRCTIPREELLKVLAAVKAGRPLHEAATQIQRLAVAFPYKTHEHAEYAAAAKHRASTRRNGPWLKPAQLEMTVDLYRPRRSGDIDGPLKTLLDVLQGIVYENDDQVSKLTVERRDDKANPRVEVVAKRREVQGEQDELVEQPEEAEPERAGAIVTEKPRPLTMRELAGRATPNVTKNRSPTQNEQEE